jgi:Ca-activated chloride channel family protein
VSTTAPRQVLNDVAARSKSPDQKTAAEYNAALSAYKNGHLTEAIDGWKSALETQKDHARVDAEPRGGRERSCKRDCNRRTAAAQQQQQQQQDQQQQQQQDSSNSNNNSRVTSSNSSNNNSSSRHQQQQQQQQSGESQQQSEQEPQGTTGERGEIKPADGDPGTVEGSGSGSGQPMTEQEVSEAEAKRFLDTLEEGKPRVPVPGRDNAGRDW